MSDRTYSDDNIVSDEWLNAPDCCHDIHGPCPVCDADEERETDQNGVEFGTNCLTPGVCRRQDLCLGTCMLF